MTDSSHHAEVRELLPVYANGSLEGSEAAAVRSHLESCATCSVDLDELLEIGRALRQRTAAAADVAPRRPRRVHMPLAGIAAALLVAVTAGIVWSYRHSSRQGAASPASHQEEMVLDLGGGAMRDGDTLPALRAPGAGTVTVLLTVPAHPDALYAADLHHPDGRSSFHQEDLGPPDWFGRLRFEVPSDRFGLSGAHQVVVRSRTPSGETWTYRYPFRVLPASERTPPDEE